jgi:methylated-DNA-[protein]-cysteine S-methyltransferase
MTMEYHYTTYRSPIGAIHLLAGSKGLKAVGLNQSFDDFRQEYARRAPGDWKKTKPEDDQILGQAVTALEAYFKLGTPLPAKFPLEMEGTSFQIKVWQALLKIPQGQTSSYGQIAGQIGHPKAARAVGSACGSNPLSLFVPCHRVVGGNGSLCGFGGGLNIKALLLKKEGIEVGN